MFISCIIYTHSVFLFIVYLFPEKFQLRINIGILIIIEYTSKVLDVILLIVYRFIFIKL